MKTICRKKPKLNFRSGGLSGMAGKKQIGESNKNYLFQNLESLPR